MDFTWGEKTKNAQDSEVTDERSYSTIIIEDLAITYNNTHYIKSIP